MSRVGKKTIFIPNGVDVKIDGQTLTAKGAKGTETITIHPNIRILFEDGKINVEIINNPNWKSNKALWGLSRALINNVIVGVSDGFTKVLEITGVGYRAFQQGNAIKLELGYSHELIFTPPEGVNLKVADNNLSITVSGSNKQQVGQAAAHIREYRPVEPYKGKGIRYKDEWFLRKVGKASASSK